MIAQIRGTLLEKGRSHIVVETAGVGYGIRASGDTIASLPGIGHDVTLFTHLAVRENAHDLYGFVGAGERDFFELLIGVSGIGPKSALAILSVADVNTLTEAIASGDGSHLTKVSGIGKKNAEKIILELKDKIDTPSRGSENAQPKDDADAIEALCALGYSASQAREALKKAPKGTGGASALLKEALKVLNS